MIESNDDLKLDSVKRLFDSLTISARTNIVTSGYTDRFTMSDFSYKLSLNRIQFDFPTKDKCIEAMSYLSLLVDMPEEMLDNYLKQINSKNISYYGTYVIENKTVTCPINFKLINSYLKYIDPNIKDEYKEKYRADLVTLTENDKQFIIYQFNECNRKNKKNPSGDNQVEPVFDFI